MAAALAIGQGSGPFKLYRGGAVDQCDLGVEEIDTVNAETSGIDEAGAELGFWTGSETASATARS